MAVNPKPFNIFEINVGSLRTNIRRQDMANFLKTHKPEVVIINETFINQQHNVAFRDYNFIRSDKIPNEPGRGTGILIKTNIKHELVDTTIWNLKTLETCAVKINTVNNHFFVVCAYRYNGGDTTIEIEDLNKIILEFRLSNSSQLIIGGDLNAKHVYWGNNNSCTSGKRLYQWLQNTQDFKLIPTEEPTYYKETYASFLDFFITSNNVKVLYPNQTNKLRIVDYPSDHRAVHLKILPEAEIVTAMPQSILNFQETNWKLFNAMLDNKLTDIRVLNHSNMTTSEIDIAIQYFTEKVNETIKSVVPTSIIRPDTQTPLPTDILNLIKYKNSLRRRWQRNKYSHYDHQLKSEIKCISKIITDRITLHNTHYWENKLKAVKLDNNTFRNIKQFTGNFKRDVIPPLNIQGSPIRANTDEDKANVIGAHFEHIHTQNQHIGGNQFTSFVNNTVKSSFSITTPRMQFSPDASANCSFIYSANRHVTSMANLNNIIRSRANKRSVGTDNIPNIVLKRMSYKSRVIISMLFNQMFNIAYFPKAWKCAITIPIPKKDKPATEPNSYRPIALLPCVSKIYECAVKDHLIQECTDLNVFPDDQFGFVHFRTTGHPLVKFDNDIVTGINLKIPTIACALDVEKAFDTVWHDGIIYKMFTKLNFSQHICQVLFNYLKERCFVVKVNNTLSRPFKITAGVPQGGVLSAILYNIYLADLPKPPAHINQIQRLQYADDTLVYVTVRKLQDGQNRINAYLKTLQEFYTLWKIKLNPGKAEAIVFKGHNKQHSKQINNTHRNVRLTVDNHTIALKDTIKYLGVIHSQNPKHIPHINYIASKALKCFQAIRPVLKRTSGLSIKIKLLCYKQLIRPILAYAFPAWSNISSHQMERMRALERKILRSCINFTRPRHSYYNISNVDLYKAAEIDRIDTFLCNQAIRFFNNWPDLEILRNCINQDGNQLDDIRTLYKTPWYIQHLNNTNRLFNQNTPVHYHRRHRIINDDNSLVYNTNT